MAYRTIESDKDGRVMVYPALYEPRSRGVCKFLRGLFKRLFSSNRK
jgi:hypothetical protein